MANTKQAFTDQVGHWTEAIYCNAAKAHPRHLDHLVRDGVYTPWRGKCNTRRRAQTRAWQKRAYNKANRAAAKADLRKAD